MEAEMMSEEKLLQYILHRAYHRVESDLAEPAMQREGFIRANVQKSLLLSRSPQVMSCLKKRLEEKLQRALRRYVWRGFPLVFFLHECDQGEVFLPAQNRSGLRYDKERRVVKSSAVFLAGRAVASTLQYTGQKTYVDRVEDHFKKVDEMLHHAGGIRMMTCTERLRTFLERLLLQKRLFVVESPCISLVYDMHRKEWKKTNAFGPGKHHVRLYEGMEIRLWVQKSKGRVHEKRRYTNFDMGAAIFEQMVVPDPSIESYTSLLKRLSKEEIDVCMSHMNESVWLIQYFVSVLGREVYQEVLYQSMPMMREMAHFYEQFCRDYAVSVNQNSFIAYIATRLSEFHQQTNRVLLAVA